MFKNERFYIGLLAAIQFSHIVDFVVLMPLGPVLMRYFSITPIQFGSLVSSYNMSAAVFGVIYGLFADKFDRKKILLFNFIGFILGTTFCGMAESFETLLIARIVAGAFGGILTSVVMALVTDLIPFERRGRAMGTVMSAFSVASVLGVPLGLLIAEKFGWKYTFYFIACFSSIVLCFCYYIIPSVSSHIREIDLKQNLQRLVRLFVKPEYLKSYSLVFMNVFAVFMLIPYLSPYAVRNIKIPETDLKYMYLVAGFFTVITARMIGMMTDRYGSFKVMFTLLIASIIPIYIYTHSGELTLFWFIAMSTLFMTMISGRMIPLMTMISEISSKEDRGTFMGLLNSIRSLGSALSTLFAGMFIVETSSGVLSGFDTVGYFSISISLFLIWGCQQVHEIMLQKKTGT